MRDGAQRLALQSGVRLVHLDYGGAFMFELTTFSVVDIDQPTASVIQTVLGAPVIPDAITCLEETTGFSRAHIGDILDYCIAMNWLTFVPSRPVATEARLRS